MVQQHVVHRHQVGDEEGRRRGRVLPGRLRGPGAGPAPGDGDAGPWVPGHRLLPAPPPELGSGEYRVAARQRTLLLDGCHVSSSTPCRTYRRPRPRRAAERRPAVVCLRRRTNRAHQSLDGGIKRPRPPRRGSHGSSKPSSRAAVSGGPGPVLHHGRLDARGGEPRLAQRGHEPAEQRVVQLPAVRLGGAPHYGIPRADDRRRAPGSPGAAPPGRPGRGVSQSLPCESACHVSFHTCAHAGPWPAWRSSTAFRTRPAGHCVTYAAGARGICPVCELRREAAPFSR